MADKEEKKDLSEKILSAKEITQRAAPRAAFHLKALGLGILAAVLCAAFPIAAVDAASAHPTLSKAAIGALTYFSLLLLFPVNPNRNATALGLLAGVGCIFTGLWPLSPVCGGLAAFIIHSANRWKLAGGSLVALIFILAGLGIAGIYLLKLLPVWYMLLFAGTVSFGIFRPKIIPAFIDKLLAKRRQKEQEKIEKEKLHLEQSQPQDPLEAAIKSRTHEEILAQINQAKGQLSEPMHESIDVVTVKARAIMQCMRDDERDIAPGNKFLERYLPMIATSVNSFVRLSSHQITSAEFEQAKEQTTQTLAAMADAFTEMHQHLLDDDVDDLLIDLKVMNQLVKIEGHKMPVDR